MTRRYTALLGPLFLIFNVIAYPQYQDQIPNGKQVPHPCKPNYIWHGLGHESSSGGGKRNPFGKDFKISGFTWTEELCRNDSDGDGKTNGEELGDPDCLWNPGEVPTAVTGLSHPGICTLPDGSICDKDKSWVDCNVKTGLENCAVLKEPETLNMTVKFPETIVPAQETTYMCMIIDLPTDTDYHLVAHEPLIDNANVMHHITLYGCDPTGKINESQVNRVAPCNMGASGVCQTVIGIWSVGRSGYCIDGPMGFLFGSAIGAFKHAALEFHWNNPELKNDYTDGSGITLYYTPKLRPNNAAILLTGQTFLEIPPGKASYPIEAVCPAKATGIIMKGPINVFWATNHMHYLGHEMKIEVNRNDSLVTTLTHDEIFTYDSPVQYEYNPTEIINPGDEIVTTCTYKSTSRSKVTLFGLSTSDEMCYGFIAYYPAEQLSSKYCLSWKSVSLNDLYDDGVYEGCNFYSFLNPTTPETNATLHLVKSKCVPSGTCVNECKTVIDNLLANHPCLSGDVIGLVRNNAKDYNNVRILELFATMDSCKSGINDDVNGAHLVHMIRVLPVAILIRYFVV